MFAVAPCERRHWNFQLSSLWDHETCEGYADIGAVAPCQRSQWGLRWSSSCGPEICDGVCRTGNGCCGAMLTQPLGPLEEPPMGLRNV
eukprot:6653792-Pyramimonas_sp.AAC.1